MIFDFIDKNKSGELCLPEWMEIFGQFAFKPQTNIFKTGLK